MSDLAQAAEKLNRTLAERPFLLHMLSARGRGIAFPWHGILGQTAEAAQAQINATIGVALEDAGQPMHLPGITSGITLASKQIVAYAPGHGLPQLRDAWAVHQRKVNPSLPSCVSRPVVVAGLTHGLSLTALLTCDPGDTLILPEPYWDNYELLFGVQYGVTIQTFPLFSGAQFNIEGLRTCLAEGKGKVVVLLNFPNNPTGFTPRMKEALDIREALREAADRGREIVVIIDDAYAGLVYEDGVYGDSLFSLLADVHEHILAVKIDGSSKEYFAWGLRIAFLTFGCRGLTPDAALALEDKAAGAVRATVSNACRLSQELLLRSLGQDDDLYHAEGLREILAKRYRAAQRSFLNTKCDQYSRLLPCNSGYFLCLELRPPCEASVVRKALLSQESIGTIALPGNLLRIAFASVPESQMEELFTRIVRQLRACTGR